MGVSAGEESWLDAVPVLNDTARSFGGCLEGVGGRAASASPLTHARAAAAAAPILPLPEVAALVVGAGLALLGLAWLLGLLSPLGVDVLLLLVVLAPELPQRTRCSTASQDVTAPVSMGG